MLLLKAHRAAGCLASLASAAVALGAAARRRVADGRTDADAGAPGAAGESPVLRSRFYGFIRAFLLLSVLLLAVELAAHFSGWDLAASALALPIIGVESLYGSWLRLRAAYLAPLLQFLTDACVVLFLIQSADRLIQCLGSFYITVKRIKPRLKSPALPDAEDPDAGYYPMVLVQIPMCNEKEVSVALKLAPLIPFQIRNLVTNHLFVVQVYQQSIAAVCNLDWPRSNFLVQVLDDSDDPTTQSLIREEVAKWQQSGARILYRHRVLRDGYKAGNLKSAMGCSYVKDYEFVAIFDADFQPNPDFLKRTVPHFKVDSGECLCYLLLSIAHDLCFQF